MAEKKVILIPIDFTEQTIYTADQSYNLARMIGAKVVLLHVIEDHGIFNLYVSKKEHEDYKKKATLQLEKLAKEKAKKSGIVVEALVTKGKIYEKINEVAEMLNASIIMMGTSGQMGLMKFIGSNTLRVIRESKIPVISIKGKTHREGCKNIIFPLDLTKETREKISKAIWLANLYGDVVVRAVSVLTSNDEFIVSKVMRQLRQTKEIIEGKGVKCTAEIIKDLGGKSYAECILAYAYKSEGDIIMIMTQQENVVTEMFIGSTAQAIINNSEIPVMSIVPGQKKQMGANTPF